MFLFFRKKKKTLLWRQHNLFYATFYTKINQTADLGEEIDNTAHLSFTNAADQDYEKDSDTPEVHTGGIKMIKVDKENSAKVLKGAEFQVFAS